MLFRLSWANKLAKIKETKEEKFCEMDFRRITRMAKIQWLSSLIISIRSQIHFSTAHQIPYSLYLFSFLTLIKKLFSAVAQHPYISHFHTCMFRPIPIHFPISNVVAANEPKSNCLHIHTAHIERIVPLPNFYNTLIIIVISTVRWHLSFLSMDTFFD